MRLRGVGVVAEEEAPSGAVVVEAFGGWVEGEEDALAAVAIQSGVIQVVTELGSVAGIHCQFSLCLSC